MRARVDFYFFIFLPAKGVGMGSRTGFALAMHSQTLSSSHFMKWVRKLGIRRIKWFARAT